MKEITMTFCNGLVSEVNNIPRGQTVITRDMDEGDIHDSELIVRRWYFDGTSEVIYEGTLEDEKWEDKP